MEILMTVSKFASFCTMVSTHPCHDDSRLIVMIHDSRACAAIVVFKPRHHGLKQLFLVVCASQAVFRPGQRQQPPTASSAQFFRYRQQTDTYLLTVFTHTSLRHNVCYCLLLLFTRDFQTKFSTCCCKMFTAN